jgi:putative Mn2+ efflux pump MntP
VLGLVALLVPLSLDTFAIAAAMAIAGLPASQRLRVSLLLAGFEAGMPLIGIGLGQALGQTVGSFGDHLAGAALVVLGAYMTLGGDDEGADGASVLARTHGLAVIALGVGVSLDELAIGFSIGLLDLPVVWAIVFIACQAFVAAQLGLRLGARLGEHLRGRAEQVAGLSLVGIGMAYLAVAVS